jgi:hypothetical protein
VIPEFEQASVDGIPVLRSASVSGRHTVALLFRVGRFDETLPTAGITHLVEHLTLSRHHKALYNFNATVSGRFTAFFAETGDPADVADFVAAVCGGLAADYADGLDREKRILRTEAASRGSAGPLGLCLNERYGALGPGLVNYQEYGLHRVGWEEIERWRRRWFVASNAVLWVHGDLPPDLRIDLPAGPAPVQVPGAAAQQPLELTLPGYLVTGRGGVGLSLLGNQSVVDHVALHILRERLTHVLRHERGLSYGVQVASELIDAVRVHTWITADALPEQTATVAHAMLTTFETLASAGSTGEELTEYGRRRRAFLEGPGGPPTALNRRAQKLLYGQPVVPLEQTIQQASELGHDAVGQAAADLLGQVIVVVPSGVPAVRGRMPQLPVWSKDTTPGTAAKSVDSDATLTLGDEGVMLTFSPDHPERRLTVRFGAVVALLRWNDGKQSLAGTDGFVLHIDPDEWPDGAALLETIGRHVDPSLVVTIDQPGPDRPGRAKRRPTPPVQAGSPAQEAQKAETGKRSGRARWFGPRSRP